MCKYCDGSFSQKPFISIDGMRVYVDAEHPLAEIKANCITSYEDMNFCPMCGRDLRGGAAIHRGTARKVWGAICNRAGFAEDRGEWQDCCDVTDYELDGFSAMVGAAIAALPSVAEGAEPGSGEQDALSDTLEKVALDMLEEINHCEYYNDGWWHNQDIFRDRLKALGVSIDA